MITAPTQASDAPLLELTARISNIMNDLSNATMIERPISEPPASRLDHLALLTVSGPDARTFLDSQLTRNVPLAAADASPAHASIAGYCSPKGRLLASIVVWSERIAEGEVISMIVSRDIADAIAKRLRMYVLRAKVVFENAHDAIVIDGVFALPVMPESIAALDVWGVARVERRSWIRYPEVGSRKRFLRIGNPDSAGGDDASSIDAKTWRWLDIRAGLPRITSATQDRFVPQMLNLEALGGVDFKKGCFPGQEVVARSQYLGKLKRRTALASMAGTTLPAPGTDVWTKDANEATGLVVNAEQGPDGRTALLVELPISAFSSTDLHVGTSDGPALTIEALPYELPDNEVFVRPKL
jgi:folate-binding protein YgfZ